MRILLTLAAMIVATHAAPLQAQVRIEYTVRIADALSHLYDIQMDIAGLRATSVDVALPAWSPGVYVIRDFSRNLQAFRALVGDGRPVRWEQRDKQTWRITKEPDDDLRVRYQVYSTELTDSLADITTPASIFLYVVGEQERPVTVEYDAPSGWDVHTGLEKRGGRYFAADYHALVDAPVVMGHFKVLDFESLAGIPHQIVISRPDVSMIEQQLVTDLKELADAAATAFGPPPYTAYTFLLKVQTPPGAGSVAYSNSSRIVVGEYDFISQANYQRVLLTAARNLVRSWLGKRAAPTVLRPMDYRQEVYTRLLWLTEGVSDYLADLLALRTGIVIPQEYYAATGTLINVLQHTPGRFAMSLEDASFNTWVRSDNSVSNTVSYTTKGEIVGLLIDLEIRARTQGQKGLTDVVSHMVATYPDGIPEDAIPKAFEAVSGSDFSEFVDANVRGRGELNYNRYLNQAGLQATVQKQPAAIYMGVEVERTETNQVRIRRVQPNSPAQRAKLDISDVLVALGGQRLTFDNFTVRLRDQRPNRRVDLTIVRGDRLLTLDLTPMDFQDETWSLSEIPNATPQQIELRKAWLGF